MNGSPLPPQESPASAAHWRQALLALSSPLLIGLALVHGMAGDWVQSLPALAIGVGLLMYSWMARRRRRGELLRALRLKRNP
ncbi:MAG: DUF3188 domain-containing protein [Cyanobacteria bacterium]|jgi:Protein of unknown function (DUF3188)|nr:DUF3188 domain-containing protein [Cyanobacteriota bacterium]